MSIHIKNLHLGFERPLISDFSIIVPQGARIAIMGRNGTGKSTLLKYIYEANQDQSAYIPQRLPEENNSGGESFMGALSDVIQQDPEILLLDEPTNHLDLQNRKQLIRYLERYSGTLLCISHDPTLLSLFEEFWHLHQGKVEIFRGHYKDYLDKMIHQKQALEARLKALNAEKEEAHVKLMAEQQRASQSRKQGEKAAAKKKVDIMTASYRKNKAQTVSGKKITSIADKRDSVISELNNLHIPEKIKLNFWMEVDPHHSWLISIYNGSVFYGDRLIFSGINLSISQRERILISGRNGSGKTTLLRGILQDPRVKTEGTWRIKAAQIGYLDQRYESLDRFSHMSLLNALESVVPEWLPQQLRYHLNNFLFRGNLEKTVTELSGGERARFSLALIAAKTPQLLLLDEITNNIDLETREHVIDIVKGYKGAMIVISHDTDFIEQLDHFNHVVTCKGEQVLID